MGRKARVFITNQPQLVNLKVPEDAPHLNTKDIQTQKSLFKFCAKYQIALHGYSLTPTQTWLLLTPQTSDSLPKFMQTFLRTFVRAYNKEHQRKGSLYTQRYKSVLVETPDFTLKVLQFIEQNTNAHSSSQPHHQKGETQQNLTPCDSYQKLGDTPQARQTQYNKILATPLPTDIKIFIQECITRQKIIGSTEFIKNLEKLAGIGLFMRAKGRPPKKINQKEKNMYQQLEVLNKETHKELKISPLENLNFAKGLHFIPILASETKALACDFPVVFNVDDKAAELIALTSLGTQNLAINPEGKWITDYVPMHLRKYPFALALNEAEPDQKIILIDVQADNINTTEGNALFAEDGNTDALEHAINFLKTTDEQTQITHNIVKLIAESGILIDQEISTEVEGETKVLVRGFKVIDREKLNALDDQTLADWTRKGIIGLIENHLTSLDKTQKLFQLASQQQ